MGLSGPNSTPSGYFLVSCSYCSFRAQPEGAIDRLHEAYDAATPNRPHISHQRLAIKAISRSVPSGPDSTDMSKPNSEARESCCNYGNTRLD